MAGNSYTYDAEGRVATAGTTTYLYDGDGQRAAKVLSNGTTRYYWRDVDGVVAEESDNNGNSWMRVNVGGKLQFLENDQNQLEYPLFDALGSVRMMLNDGDQADPVSDTDYYPFGGEVHTSVSTPDEPYRFTGKERDTESGLDYFGARYYASSMGRWMSPDWASHPEAVPYSSLDNPQSLNLYGYVGNNPLNRFDPDGHCWPQWLCNFGTKLKNEVLHGEFTTDTNGAKIRQLDRQEAKTRQQSRWREELKQHPPKVMYNVVAPVNLITLLPQLIPRTTYLYQKLGPNGEHLKYGISNDPNGRYSASELNGGRLKILAEGSREDMLQMERNLHETMPIGPEEGQSFYQGIQAGKGLATPPYESEPIPFEPEP